MNDIETFRLQTRAWLEENCPMEMRGVLAEADEFWGGRSGLFSCEAQRLWFERMATRGWTVPTWPKEYGGAGLSQEEALILAQEMRVLKCKPPILSFGIWMLGPALLKFGTHKQKIEHLPKIARGEIRWCQGYSEPNAGSDLAALAARADDCGDYFTINGQKIWTSYGDKADWMFCLVRTDTSKKHAGISFVLFDMETPGVSTKPIQLISGKSPFCETFLDNVRVEKRNLVGEINQGWDVAKYLLTHEREMIGAMGDQGGSMPLGQSAVLQVGKDAMGRLAEPMLRAQIAEYEMDEAAFSLTMLRAGDLAKARLAHTAMSSLLKYYGAELNKRRWELMVSAVGSNALEWESDRSNQGGVARTWLRTKGNSIEGGTSEVQLNVIAKRILELPGA